MNDIDSQITNIKIVQTMLDGTLSKSTELPKS
jgi:hypothetical protein